MYISLIKRMRLLFVHVSAFHYIYTPFLWTFKHTRHYLHGCTAAAAAPSATTRQHVHSFRSCASKKSIHHHTHFSKQNSKLDISCCSSLRHNTFYNNNNIIFRIPSTHPTLSSVHVYTLDISS